MTEKTANLAFEIPSPCVNICKIPEGESLCTGCLRSREEIRNWRKSDNVYRLEVLEQLKARRHARAKLGQGKIGQGALRHRGRRKQAGAKQ